MRQDRRVVPSISFNQFYQITPDLGVLLSERRMSLLHTSSSQLPCQEIMIDMIPNDDELSPWDWGWDIIDDQLIPTSTALVKSVLGTSRSIVKEHKEKVRLKVD